MVNWPLLYKGCAPDRLTQHHTADISYGDPDMTICSEEDRYSFGTVKEQVQREQREELSVPFQYDRSMITRCTLFALRSMFIVPAASVPTRSYYSVASPVDLFKAFEGCVEKDGCDLLFVVNIQVIPEILCHSCANQ